MLLNHSNLIMFLSGIPSPIVVKTTIKVSVSKYLSIEVVVVFQTFMRLAHVFGIIETKVSLFAFSKIYISTNFKQVTYYEYMFIR